eukprot:scaffold67606_cov67-Phaeocystis_antarctica.AAC.6
MALTSACSVAAANRQQRSRRRTAAPRTSAWSAMPARPAFCKRRRAAAPRIAAWTCVAAWQAARNAVRAWRRRTSLHKSSSRHNRLRSILAASPRDAACSTVAARRHRRSRSRLKPARAAAEITTAARRRTGSSVRASRRRAVACSLVAHCHRQDSAAASISVIDVLTRFNSPASASVGVVNCSQPALCRSHASASRCVASSLRHLSTSAHCSRTRPKALCSRPPRRVAAHFSSSFSSATTAACSFSRATSRLPAA